MCGFLVYPGTTANNLPISAAKVQYRGPDSTQEFHSGDITMIFNRLAIMDLSSAGNQPFTSKRSVLVCNGEIYNFQQLATTLLTEISFHSNSDCEVLIPLYEKLGPQQMLATLDGEFALALWDHQEKTMFAARDPMGIRPLFYGRPKGANTAVAAAASRFAFASEAKALVDLCDDIRPFPPGHYYYQGTFYAYANLAQTPLHQDPVEQVLANIRHKLTDEVIKRLQSDAPVGFLLSGGLDSSLVCAIAARFLHRPLTTFAIGLTENPIDIHYARIVAQYLGTKHHEVLFTKEQMREALPTIIYHLESYDITTVRASVGMYLLCQYIRQHTEIKVVLTGEVSDELFGYKYTDFAPSPAAFQAEAAKRVAELYVYDVLRADRCISAHSLEARVPFSGQAFVSYVMGIQPTLKINTTGMGKYLLRKAFDDGTYLPPEILYRDKAAFSDAVGHGAVEDLQAWAEELYSDEEFARAQASGEYSHLPPVSKEALMYRKIFENFFPGQGHWIPAYWLPNRQWANCNVTDPSARVLPNYGNSGRVL